VEHLIDASLGQAPALPANIRLRRKGVPGTITLSYYKTRVNYWRKKFYKIGPWIVFGPQKNLIIVGDIEFVAETLFGPTQLLWPAS
jgi:hypothetical protein